MDQKTPFVIGIGEVLWDMLPEGKRCGGAPANVVYHLTKLGIKSAIISSVGNDSDGIELLQFLNSHGVCTDFITQNELKTGVVNVELHDGIPQYDICCPAAWDNIILPEKLQNLLPDTSAVIFGTLGQRGNESRKTIQCLLSLLPESCLRIFDINLRQSYYNEDLIRSSLEVCEILKINDEELEILSKMFGISGTHETIVKTLAEKYSLKAVILTLGAKGSMLFDGKNFSEYPVQPCKVVDTVGCGDSFLAAWCASVLNGESMENAMHAGTKLSAEIASRTGAI